MRARTSASARRAAARPLAPHLRAGEPDAKAARGGHSRRSRDAAAGCRYKLAALDPRGEGRARLQAAEASAAAEEDEEQDGKEEREEKASGYGEGERGGGGGEGVGEEVDVARRHFTTTPPE